MSKDLLEKFEDRSDHLFVHFDVKDHYLNLDTFIQTAECAQDIIDALDETLFKSSLQYELIILPPEDGSFLSKLGICVFSSVSAVFAFLSTELGAAFTKGLTGETPSYWFEQAGYELRKGTLLLAEQLTLDEETPNGATSQKHETAFDDDIACKTVARLVVFMTRGLLEKQTDELTKIGIEIGSLPDALDARANFYTACIENPNIKRIGFTPNDDFPVPRSSFPERALKPMRKEKIEEPTNWQISIDNIYVTSPNWDEEDQKTRQWKGKDQIRRDCFFVIEDAEFWQLVRKKKLHVDVLDNLKVQWACQLINGKPKNRRVLRVLEFNGETLAEPLASNTIKAILGDYSQLDNQWGQPSLFDD